MDGRQFLVVVITLAIAAAFLFIWMRRDRGVEPRDDLLEALSAALEGRKPPGLE